MVCSFLQFELKAPSAVRVEPGTERRPLLRGEVEPRVANRSVRLVASPAAGRRCVLATSDELRSPDAKAILPQEASSDELNAPFSEASCGAVRLLFILLDIQVREGREGFPI